MKPLSIGPILGSRSQGRYNLNIPIQIQHIEFQNTEEGVDALEEARDRVSSIVENGLKALQLSPSNFELEVDWKNDNLAILRLPLTPEHLNGATSDEVAEKLTTHIKPYITQLPNVELIAPFQKSQWTLQ